MNCLWQYKLNLIKLGTSLLQRKILEDSFARWYFICDKMHIFPTKNIVLINDLEYANTHRAAGFDVSEFFKNSEEVYGLFRKDLCLALDAELNSNIPEMSKTYKITDKQMIRLKQLYRGPAKRFNCISRKLLTLYNLLGSENLHLSIPPIFKGVELFGSPLNTHNDEYCSPFKIESYFRSLGSFWNYSFHKNGVYLCNPPFDEELIRKAANKIIDDINKTKYKVIVIVTIPVWDSHTQEKYSIEDFGLRFKGLDILKKNSYLKDHEILDKKKFPYWNYFTEKCVHASWTHLLILSNLNNIFYRKNFCLDELLNAWQDFHQ